MAYTPDSPLSLNAIRKEMVEATEHKNVILAAMAGTSYTPPDTMSNSRYSIDKRMLAAAQKEAELLNILSPQVIEKLLIVTVTAETVDDTTTYTADKTAEEICTAVLNGKPVLVFMDGDDVYKTCDISFEAFDEETEIISVNVGWFDSEGTRVVMTITDESDDT